MARSNHSTPTEGATKTAEETQGDKLSTSTESKSGPPPAPRKARHGRRLSVRTDHPGRRGYVACGHAFGPEPIIFEADDLSADAFERLTSDPLLVVDEA